MIFDVETSAVDLSPLRSLEPKGSLNLFVYRGFVELIFLLYLFSYGEAYTPPHTTKLQQISRSASNVHFNLTEGSSSFLIDLRFTLSYLSVPYLMRVTAVKRQDSGDNQIFMSYNIYTVL